jgi:Transient receptor potential (TRP) ion channel
MTVLLIFLMILAAVAIVMLAFKLILELWGRCGHLSKRSQQIRSEYWRIAMVTMVRLILIVFGTWALYCFFQFREGDSWAAMVLAAVTLAIFTSIIIFFTVRIFYLASKARKLHGGVDKLYEHEPWMKKYGFFYNQFKSPLWWFFVPIITMSVIRAFFLVFAAGSGLIQAIGILSAESIFLFVLFWRRPYDGRGANVVNAMIAVTRVVSIVCILIFVQELGIAVFFFSTANE